MPPKRKAAKAAAVPAAAAEPAIDWTKKTVAQLKAECKKQGLDCDGKKADLIDRLQCNSNGPSPPKMQKQNTLTKALDELKKSAANEKKKKSKSHAVDKLYPGATNGVVYQDYDCMLNQTNIGHNNNKYYVIQVVQELNMYFTWNRWGRVGESGANSMRGYSDPDEAVEDFKKKFFDKTKNQWEDREKFKAVAGKYTLLDMGDDDEEEEVTMTVATKPTAGVPSKTKTCSLDPMTASLVKLLFDHNMFKEALVKMEIDIKKMPLGKLSKAQIVKGFEVLDQIQNVLDKKKKGNVTQLSSEFYTHIPHDFGRQRPAIIDTPELLRKKLDMLITLGDIEMAQDMLKKEDQLVKQEDDLPLHPLDSHYQLLHCNLALLKAGDKEFQVIEKYFEATKPGYGAKKILHVWRVDRENEGQRFKEHDPVDNRKLLWHGTNVAVVAAILKSGLRIMPHSGGRVGRGIYFASENAKSAGYVGCAQNIGIMFLNEVALGKEKTITMDDSSLKAPPQGFDSIIARGRQEPDAKHDVKIEIDGRHVIVPQGKPIQTEHSNSSFHQSEYLIYKENQCRIRYLLQIQFN